jgi:hypothetical protein
MKRVTYEVLKSLESRIQKFWEEFVLSPAYEYYSVAFFFPGGHSSIRKLEEGMTGRECYYWMQGFLSAYYKIKGGEIPTPRLAPAGKKMWLVFHSDGEESGCDLIYAPEELNEDELLDMIWPTCTSSCVRSARLIESTNDIFIANGRLDTINGEQDAI